MNFALRKSHIFGIDSRTFLFSLIILAANVAVRGWFNLHTAMSRDEPYTLYFAQLPIRQFLPIVLESNNPPTFEVLVHFWSQLVGSSERALRWLPTIIISLGAIPFSLIGKRIGGYPAMWFSAILFLGSSALMNFSHLDRAYCLLITGAIFQIYFLIKLHESASWKHSAGWIIATTLICYSHYFGWCMPVLNWFILFALPTSSGTWIRRMIGPTLIALLFTSPLFFYLITQLSAAAHENTFKLSTPSALNVFQIGTEFLNSKIAFSQLLLVGTAWGIFKLKRSTKNTHVPILMLCLTLLTVSILPAEMQQNQIGILLFALLLVSFLACLMAIKRNEDSLSEKVIFYWSLLPLVSFFVVSSRFPVFIDRYLSFALPSLLLLVVILFSQLSRLWLRYAFAASFLILFMVGFRFTPQYNVDNREAIELFKRYHSKAEFGIIGPGYHDLDFTYYFNRSIFYNGAAHMSDTSGIKLIDDTGFARHKEGLHRELLKNRMIVSHDSSDLDLEYASSIAFYDGNTSLSYPQNGIYDYLLERYGEPLERASFGSIYNVYLFEKK